ncbi:hypothetical protein D5F53_24435 [Paenibacillus lautus]|uniref:Uncharacterized protein n=1 Tax=Paenibacillus lautus TaxID=1401 RepID=A0A385TR47_PAELA|nr:hypothetical protein D5F53_24435 [Paenibacillus lautus]
MIQKNWILGRANRYLRKLVGGQQSIAGPRHSRRHEDRPVSMRGAIKQGRLARHRYSADHLPIGAVVYCKADLVLVNRNGLSKWYAPPLYNGAYRQDKRVSLKEEKFGYSPLSVMLGEMSMCSAFRSRFLRKSSKGSGIGKGSQ